ncbi:MAG: lipocalin family protein [Spirochaetota bacterium]
MKIRAVLSLLSLCLLPFFGCTEDKAFIRGLPEIQSFSPEKYMGTWYEIARFQHSFEKDLMKVTATYTLRPDGKVSVINAGFLISNPSERKEAKAVAYLKKETQGYLKVSFFRPFYGDYRIIALDEKDYQYALVASSTKDYLWILSRTPKLDPAVYAQLVKTAQKAGLDTGRLFLVPQE